MQCTDESSDTRNCGGCGSVCGSGQSCCGGNCSDPMTDPNNCGGCGTVCVVRNGTATCVGGTCAIGSCNTGYADCDHSYMNGCETQTSADTSNCGSCNHVCAE